MSSEGGRFCACCDEPILPTDKSTTFVKISNSAGGWTFEIHDDCAEKAAGERPPQTRRRQ
ncbi:hypothetical protein AB0J38_25720 [Streptomyces sp. NPDC050095]|uniref:hypothetical protein n=1 Tax=unclassified Streptomyces TaxID=2593676 RepID=UPI0034497115